MNPIRIKRERRWLRPTSFGLIGLVTVANAWSAILLIGSLLRAQAGEEPGPLMASGGAIWLTNVIAFALWYWQLDRGGPVSRAHARRTLPDFQFVQMDHPALAHEDWEPAFLDYFYLSFTNATAFSPTDVMPLSRWAKMLMLPIRCITGDLRSSYFPRRQPVQVALAAGFVCLFGWSRSNQQPTLPRRHLDPRHRRRRSLTGSSTPLRRQRFLFTGSPSVGRLQLGFSAGLTRCVFRERKPMPS
jgi:hypothetical protein